MWRWLKSVVTIVLVTLVILELFSYLLLKINYLKGDMAGFPLSQPLSRFWVELNPTFGFWHYPNYKFRHKKSCFDIEYRTNSAGMRDKERVIAAPAARTVVLGDSFIEGVGSLEGERLTDLLELKTGSEYLNFGISGTGLTQTYLLYKTLAKNYSHDSLIIGVLPENDFFDDDRNRFTSVDRYRPFWVGEYPEYKIEYNKPNFSDSSKIRYFDIFLRNFSNLYNAVHYIIKTHRLKNRTAVNHGFQSYSGYYDFSNQEYDRLRFSLEKILEEAKGKTIYLLLIPSQSDFLRYERDGEAPLSIKLREFAIQQGIELIDLLPWLHRQHHHWSEYYLSCDGHWSRLGNEMAAQHVLSKMESREGKK